MKNPLPSLFSRFSKLSTTRERSLSRRLTRLFLRFSKLCPQRLQARLGNLQSYLAKASIKTGFNVYVGLMVFATTVTGLAVFTLSIPVFLLLGFQAMQALGVALLAGALSVFLSIGICHAYPMIVAQNRGNAIDANLPTIANFISVLASSGMPPEAIFRSLARVGAEFGVRQETSTLIGEIELAGLDLNTALKRASERSPSKQFASMIDGVITTTHMGGDLATFLRGEADKFKRSRMVKMKRFLDNLAVIAEAYVTFMVAAPLALIVMLSVMAFIGGSNVMMGGMDAGGLLNLMTFVFLPTGIAVMILAVDNMNPQK
jgi:flagellar protein FlaJ